MHAECGQRERARRRPRSTPCDAPADASSRSARPRCGFWKARRATTAPSSPFAGETALFITPGYPLSRRRRDDDEFPSAALDPVHAGLPRFPGSTSMKRAYAHAIAAAIGSIRMAMPACCSGARITESCNARPIFLSRHGKRWRRPLRRDRRRRMARSRRLPSCRSERRRR